MLMLVLALLLILVGLSVLLAPFCSPGRFRQCLGVFLIMIAIVPLVTAAVQAVVFQREAAWVRLGRNGTQVDQAIWTQTGIASSATTKSLSITGVAVGDYIEASPASNPGNTTRMWVTITGTNAALLTVAPSNGSTTTTVNIKSVSRP